MKAWLIFILLNGMTLYYCEYLNFRAYWLG